MRNERMCRGAVVGWWPASGAGWDFCRRVATVAVVGAVFCSAGSAALAQVFCTNPDDLCVGNPCVMRDVEVASPCVVDFGSRTVRIRGKMRVPNGGILELRGGSIFVEQPILGRHTEVNEGDGAFVTLIATETVSVDRRIDVSARNTPGRIVLIGTNVWVRGSLRAKAKGKDATAAGGEVVVIAARNLATAGSGPVEVRGGTASPGGTAAFVSGAGLTLRKAVDARGSSGGTVFVNGMQGGIDIGHTIEVDGRKEQGGSIDMTTALDIRIQKKVVANGRTAGGSISLAGRSVTIGSPVRARSSMGPGGSVSLSGEQMVTANKEMSATGTQGGTIEISSPAGDVNLNGMLDVTGRRTSGGSLAVTAGQDLIDNGVIEADGSTAGGDVDLTAGSLVRLTKRARIFAEGDSGGFVDIIGASANVETGAGLEVDGVSVGGEVRLTATSGDLVLSGQFRARGDSGGVIEGVATGDVTADGDFQSRTAGCTGLSAGGTVDVTEGNFDGPVEDTCN